MVAAAKKDVDVGITVKKNQDFSEWYTQVVHKAELADIRYGVQGFIVHMPWGFRILRRLYELLEEEVEKDGHQPFLFPLVIKKENLAKEQEHAGFTPEVFWITKAGDKMLEEDVALRPTGETQIYPLYALWIRGHGDLPYKGYQSRICVYRSEKTTRPFLRGREFMFFETHDVFATHDDALKQVETDIEISQRVILKQCKVPFLFFKRPAWDVFKGALRTYTSDTLMPDGRRNQLGSTHDLGQKFSRAFNIQFQDERGEKQYAWQTCFGPGIWRIFAAIIGIHGDDKGLVLPFDLAPVQVVLVPIYYSDEEKKTVLSFCEKICKMLPHFRTFIDASPNSPGYKFNHWEMKGVPLRLEIGPREASSEQATVVTRTSQEKTKVPLKTLGKDIQRFVRAVDEEIGRRAAAYFKDNTKHAQSLAELRKIIQKKPSFVVVPFCSVEQAGASCAEKLKEATDGVYVCGTLYPEEKKAEGNCIMCGKKAGHMVYTAKSY